MLKKHYIALALVLLLVLVLFNLPGQTAAKFKLAIGSSFLWLIGLTGSTQQLAEKAGNAVVPRKDLIRENEKLRRENEQLKLRAYQTEEVWKENAQLRRALAWQKQQPISYKLARVIARDPANWWRTIHIDLGSRDGVQTNMPVRTMEGLVGRVFLVGVTTSRVALLGDPNLRVGALVQETQETGVVFSNSSSPLENNMVDLGYLSRHSTLKPGQKVVTSGEGGVFPKGIPIGLIVDTQLADNGLSTEARVKLAARMNALEEVWVMFP